MSGGEYNARLIRKEETGEQAGGEGQVMEMAEKGVNAVQEGMA